MLKLRLLLMWMVRLRMDRTAGRKKVSGETKVVVLIGMDMAEIIKQEERNIGLHVFSLA